MLKSFKLKSFVTSTFDINQLCEIVLYKKLLSLRFKILKFGSYRGNFETKIILDRNQVKLGKQDCMTSSKMFFSGGGGGWGGGGERGLELHRCFLAVLTFR